MADDDGAKPRTFNDDLYNIFTYYANMGDKSDPELLDDGQFKRLCSDAGITREDKVLQEEIQLIYSSCTSKAGMKKMNYETFINSLLVLA